MAHADEIIADQHRVIQLLSAKLRNMTEVAELSKEHIVKDSELIAHQYQLLTLQTNQLHSKNERKDEQIY